MPSSEKDFIQLTVCVSACHGVLFCCEHCVLAWVTKILMRAILKVYVGHVWPIPAAWQSSNVCASSLPHQPYTRCIKHILSINN